MLWAVVQVKPSLLHGDLWSGNLSVVEGGQWAILDPACYYGMSPALHDGEALRLSVLDVLQYLLPCTMGELKCPLDGRSATPVMSREYPKPKVLVLWAPIKVVAVVCRAS